METQTQAKPKVTAIYQKLPLKHKFKALKKCVPFFKDDSMFIKTGKRVAVCIREACPPMVKIGESRFFTGKEKVQVASIKISETTFFVNPQVGEKQVEAKDTTQPLVESDITSSVLNRANG